MTRRASVGLVVLLVVGLGLTVTVGDPPCARAASISIAHPGGCVGAWMIDAPEFDATAAIAIAPPVRVGLTAAPPRPITQAPPRAHVLRFAPKTSPPGSLVPDVEVTPRTRRSHDPGNRT